MRNFVLELGITILVLGIGILAIFIIKNAPMNLTGMVVSHVNVSQAYMSDCSVTIPAGKDLVSFFCLPRTISRDNITSQLSSLDRMFTYDSSDTSDHWKAYKPGLPSWTVSDIETMGREQAYWIFLGTAEYYEFHGFLASGQNIALTQGWNLVGTATNSTTYLDDFFASIDGSYNLVISFNNTNKAVLYYYPLGNGVNTFNTSQPYVGYWINMSVASVWSPP
jgi:hypothetical protein